MNQDAKLITKLHDLYQMWLEDLPMSNGFDDEILYHYTTPSGLKGMLENHELWSSNLAYVNDAKELKLGISIFTIVAEKLRYEYKTENWEEILKELEADSGSELNDELLLQLLTSEHVRKSFLMDLLAKNIRNSLKKEVKCKLITINILEEILNRLSSKNTSSQYGCCFTENGDQLSQWRAYGAYSVGFRTHDLLSGLELDVQACKVIYGQKQQEEIASSLIVGYIDYLIKNLIDDFNGIRELEMNSIIAEIVNLVEEQIDRLVVSFKHEGFSEEKERRIYLSTNKLEIINVREKNNLFIPFLKLKMKDNAHLPIKEVYISPTADFERSDQGLRFILDKNGYDHVEIKHSSIPYRI